MVLAGHAETILFSRATVHTVSGETFSPGDVLVRDGKIAAVGAQLSAEGGKVIDLTGKHLYPGIIALNTALGLTEIGSVRGTEDYAEVGEYTPDVESWVAVNPDSELLPVSRANGICLFEPVPQGGIVAGQSGVVRTGGWTSEEMTIRKPSALHVYWPSMELDTTPPGKARAKTRPKSLAEQAKERRAKLEAITDFIEDARAYGKARQEENAKSDAVDRVPAYEAMQPYVRGELPVVVHADEARQIRSAVTWAITNRFKIIIAGGRDAARESELLALHKVPVIYAQTLTQPARDSDPYDRPYASPALLDRAGVKVALSIGLDSFNAPLVKNLPYSAAQAVAYGLGRETALKTITLYPAEIAGIADRFGSIEVGKEATLVASDADIFDIRARITQVWFAGREQSLDNRHTRLYQKYKDRPRPAGR